jgi:phage terminase large subunit
VVEINWDDNPWFPKELEQERLHCLQSNPDEYDFIWNGKIRKLLEGSYYSRQLMELVEKNRITSVKYNPNYPVDTYWDIGFSDYTSIWLVQKIGLEFRVIDFIQNNGEHPAFYAKELSRKGYTYRTHYLPHDAKQVKFGMTKSIEEQLSELLQGSFQYTKAGYNIVSDIQATRMFIPRCMFDEENCEEGIKSLRNYGKKWNSDRNQFDDKPYHNWASHAADAFRYFAMENIDSNDMALAYDYNNLSSPQIKIEVVSPYAEKSYF